MLFMSPMEEDIQPWLRYAESDIASAEVLHGAGQHLNALFHLQQAVEKTLKAVIVKTTGNMPLRIHSLHKLVERCGLQLTSEQAQLIEDLTASYTDSRYPEQWDASTPHISAEETAKFIAATKEFIAWLKQQL